MNEEFPQDWCCDFPGDCDIPINKDKNRSQKMAQERHAIVDKAGEVVNVVIWEGAEWMPPRDHYVVRDDGCDVGDLYNFDKGTFTKHYDRVKKDGV